MTDTPWRDPNLPEPPKKDTDPFQFPDVSFDAVGSTGLMPESEATSPSSPPSSEPVPSTDEDAASEPAGEAGTVEDAAQPENADSWDNQQPAQPENADPWTHPQSAQPENADPWNNQQPAQPENADPWNHPQPAQPENADSWNNQQSAQPQHTDPWNHQQPVPPQNSGNYGPNPAGSYPPPYTPPYDPSEQPPSYSPMGGGWGIPNPPEPPRPKAGKQQKFYLGIIGLLTAVLVVGFVGYAAYSAIFGDPAMPPLLEDTPSSSQNESSGEGTDSQTESSTSPVPDPGEGGTIEISPTPSGDALIPRDVYSKISPSVVGIVTTITDSEGDTSTDQGSGIVATENGYIITNSHVVGDSRSTEVKIVTRDETEYPGVVVGYDRTTDLAIVKIDAEGLTPAEFGDSDLMQVGDTVFAIGNPGGLTYASSMTMGIVSAQNRVLGSNSKNGMTYIQTDAAINPGNSGGALVNEYGQVIGINSSKLVAPDFEGMGFAIPVSKALDILNSLMNVGYVEGRTRLGITGQDVTEEQAEFYDIPQGFLIMAIDEDSDIGTAGGKVEDIICGVDGETVTCLTDISNLLLNYSPGDTIELTLYRRSEKKELTITVTLLEDKGETQSVN